MPQFIKSKIIKSVKYDNSILFICFYSGGNYKYFAVPHSIYLGLLAAPLPDLYFYQFIKNKFERVSIE